MADGGKLSVLDRLLSRLKAEDHRVLIYSQMTRMIDILEVRSAPCSVFDTLHAVFLLVTIATVSFRKFFLQGHLANVALPVAPKRQLLLHSE